MLQKHVKLEDGVLVGGWRIRVAKAAIDASNAKDALSQQLQLGDVPEMVFSKNRMSLEHEETGFLLYFDAVDALGLVAHSPPQNIKVKASQQWTHSNQSHVDAITEQQQQQGALTPEQHRLANYDWTFTTPYTGSIQCPKGYSTLDHWAPPSTSSSTTTPAASSSSSSSTTTITPLTKGGSGPVPPPFIPMDKLKLPDPILFYDEVHLFEDELSDNGISELSVKLRVMPQYWFCLLRQWIRVDDVLFRVLDCRMYCEYGSNRILRECTRREAPWSVVEPRIRDLKQLNDVNYISSIIPITEGPVMQILEF
jgi:type 2A phosphatase activator TIP41